MTEENIFMEDFNFLIQSQSSSSSIQPAQQLEMLSPSQSSSSIQPAQQLEMLSPSQPSCLGDLTSLTTSTESPLPSEYEDDQEENESTNEGEELQNVNEVDEYKKYILKRKEEDRLVAKKYKIFRKNLEKEENNIKKSKEIIKNSEIKIKNLKKNIKKFLKIKNTSIESPFDSFRLSYKCPICFEYKSGLKMIILCCTHYFCRKCLKDCNIYLCPICKRPMLNLYKVVEQGERLTINSLHRSSITNE